MACRSVSGAFGMQGKMATILVADDEPAIASHVANTGRDALSLAEERPPDVILSDVMMPQASRRGYTCRALKNVLAHMRREDWCRPGKRYRLRVAPQMGNQPAIWGQRGLGHMMLVLPQS